jgi:hypothetical protein
LSWLKPVLQRDAETICHGLIISILGVTLRGAYGNGQLVVNVTASRNGTSWPKYAHVLPTGMKTTTIHKPRPTKNFTTFHNEMLQDTRLSFAALGILSMMLSRPWDWKSYVDWLSTQRRERKKEIQICLKELETHGYLRRERVRGENGKLASMVWHWDGTPSDGFPSDGTSSDGVAAPTKDRTNKGWFRSAEVREGKKKDKGSFVPKRTVFLKNNVFKPLFPYPQSEEEMVHEIEIRGFEPNLDYDGNFFSDFSGRGWKMPNGDPVYDWFELYQSRVLKTTGEDLIPYEPSGF